MTVARLVRRMMRLISVGRLVVVVIVLLLVLVVSKCLVESRVFSLAIFRTLVL